MKSLGIRFAGWTRQQREGVKNALDYVQRLRGDNASLQVQLRTAETEKHELQRTVRELRQEIEAQRESLKTLRENESAYRHLEGEVATLRRRLSSAAQAVERLNGLELAITTWGGQVMAVVPRHQQTVATEAFSHIHQAVKEIREQFGGRF